MEDDSNLKQLPPLPREGGEREKRRRKKKKKRIIIIGQGKMYLSKPKLTPPTNTSVRKFHTLSTQSLSDLYQSVSLSPPTVSAFILLTLAP
jgi:hypothetical protein